MEMNVKTIHKNKHSSAVRDPKTGTGFRTVYCNHETQAEYAISSWRSVTCKDCLRIGLYKRTKRKKTTKESSKI